MHYPSKSSLQFMTDDFSLFSGFKFCLVQNFFDIQEEQEKICSHHATSSCLIPFKKILQGNELSFCCQFCHRDCYISSFNTDWSCSHQYWLTGHFLSTMEDIYLCILLGFEERHAFLPSSDVIKTWAEFLNPSL